MSHDPIAKLAAAQQRKEIADRDVLVAVIEARANGMFWREIGDALGLEKSTTIMRYAAKIKTMQEAGQLQVAVTLMEEGQ